MYPGPDRQQGSDLDDPSSGASIWPPPWRSGVESGGRTHTNKHYLVSRDNVSVALDRTALAGPCGVKWRVNSNLPSRNDKKYFAPYLCSSAHLGHIFRKA